MTTTLSEGVKVPDVGSVNWAGDLEVNWNLLNGALANLSGNVKLDRDNTWTGEQSFTLPIVGSITGTAAKAIADEDGTSIKTGYVNVAGNQTVSGDKSFTGSNTFNSILPNATNSYSLGSSSYQWSSVYAQTYYYNGTQWGLDKANTWTGSNRFRNFGVQSANTIDITQSTYANSQNCGGIGFSDAVNRFWGDIELNVKTDAASEMVFNLSNWRANGTQGVTALRFRYDKTLTTVDFFGADRVVNLGTSTNKWKTLNGINPGALSLPKNSNSASFNIDTTNWTTDGSIIIYTPLLDGWLYINARNDDTNGDSFIIFDDGVSGFGTSVFGNKGLQNSGVGLLCLMMPVNKNNYINIRIKSPGIISARLYPCNGNV